MLCKGVGGTIRKNSLEGNLIQFALSLQFQEHSMYPYEFQVDKGEIKTVDEYDIALSRFKGIALDSASFANRKEFMMLHFEDVKVR